MTANSAAGVSVRCSSASEADDTTSSADCEAVCAAVTASASGLDPHISPAYAALQVPRVARVSGLPEDEVRRLVATHTDGRALGFLGAPGVDVNGLNLAVRAAGG